jgi:hypothetical protein
MVALFGMRKTYSLNLSKAYEAQTMTASARVEQVVGCNPFDVP